MTPVDAPEFRKDRLSEIVDRRHVRSFVSSFFGCYSVFSTDRGAPLCGESARAVATRAVATTVTAVVTHRGVSSRLCVVFQFALLWFRRVVVTAIARHCSAVAVAVFFTVDVVVVIIAFAVSAVVGYVAVAFLRPRVASLSPGFSWFSASSNR